LQSIFASDRIKTARAKNTLATTEKLNIERALKL
jgi:hypothetical protein